MKTRRGIATLFLMFTVMFGTLAVPQPVHAAPVVGVVVAIAASIGAAVVSVASFIASVVVAVGTLIANVAIAAWNFVSAIGGAFSAAFEAASFVEGVSAFFVELGGAVIGFGAELATAMETFFASVGEAWGQLAESFGFGSGAENGVVTQTTEACTGTGVCASGATVTTSAGGATPSGFSGLNLVSAPSATAATDVIVVHGTFESYSLLTVEGITGLGTAGASALAVGDVFTYEYSPEVERQFRVVENVTTPGSPYPTYQVEIVEGVDRVVVEGIRQVGGYTADQISVMLAGANIGTPGTAASVAAIIALFGNNSNPNPLCTPIGVKVFDDEGWVLKQDYVYLDTFKNHVSGMDVNRGSDIYHGTAGNPSPQGVRSCKLVDPTSFPTCWTVGSYNSPGDNVVMKWNGTDWYHNAASGNNNWYRHMTCSTLAPPEANLVASKTQILPGEEVSLLWSSPYGDVRQASCLATNFSLDVLVPAHQECWQTVEGGEGGNPIVIDICEDIPDTYEPRPFVGTTLVSPTQTTTYEYTCTNANGTRKSQTTVEVVNPADLPDLTAGTITPVSVPAELPVTLSASVLNLGTVPAGSFTSLLEIDDDADHATIPFAGFSSIAGLGGGSSATISFTNTFPVAGEYYGRVCADSILTPPGLGSITEGDEDNNCGEWTTITVTSSVLPDLIVTTPVSPTQTPAGVPVTFSATVVNVGLGATPAGFSNLFQIDDDGVAPILVERADVSPVLIAPANDVTQVSYTFSTQGAYKVRACTDAGSNLADPLAGTIFESREDNNCGPWTDVTVLASSAQCTDGIDNDGDGLTDATDPDCISGGTNGEGYSCTVSSNSVPLGGSVTYTARNGSGPYTWTASDGTPIPSTSATAVRTFTTAGSYGMSVSGASPFTNKSCPLVSACDICLPPVVSIRALPTLVDPRAPGGSATLYWTADTGSCTITSSQTGSIFSGTPTGVEQTLPVSGITRQTRYTLSCTNPAGTSEASVMVNILGKFDEI